MSTLKLSNFKTLLAMAALPFFAAAADEAYLFSYFKGEKAGLHLAYSYDGLKWTALNGDKPLLVPQVGKDRLMRDPCICQGPDGTFHMVWTSSWRDRIIGYASSKDLIHWSEQRAIPVMEHEPDARNSWAPEITYDDESAEFYIYWATSIPGRHSLVETSDREKEWNHRIYLVTTKDFQTFSPAKLWFNPDFSVIDSAIVRVPGGKPAKWMMVLKNENSAPVEKNLRVTYTDSLGKSFPTNVSAPICGWSWVEGPAPLAVGNDILVFCDCYTRKRYSVARSSDGGLTWTDDSANLSLPKGIRHGTAFAVDKAFVEKLAETLP